MKQTIKCPTCKSEQLIGSKCRAQWTCPCCGKSIVPTREFIRKNLVV